MEAHVAEINPILSVKLIQIVKLIQLVTMILHVHKWHRLSE